MNSVEFPGLGLEFDIDPVAFRIGSFEMRWYGILIAVGFLLAIIYAFSRIKNFGIDSDRAVDVVLFGALGGLIGARLYYVIFSWSEYADEPLKIFRIWEGGLAIYGGLIGAFVFGAIFCKVRKVKLLPMFDLAAASIPIGQAIGRWGNFVNSEAFGSNTTLPWGMTGSRIVSYLTANRSALAGLGVEVDPSVPVHPTFLYESLWCALGFLVLALYLKHRRYDGELTLIYVAWYGFGRVFIEGLRTDSLLIGTVRVSQLLSLIICIAAIIAMIVIRSKIKRSHDPEYMKLYASTEEAEMIRNGTFYKKKTADETTVSEEEADGKNEDVTEE